MLFMLTQIFLFPGKVEKLRRKNTYQMYKIQ